MIFLFFKKFSTHFNNSFDVLFLCYEKVECATRCRKRRSRLKWKVISFFSFVCFRSCKSSSWRVAKLCLLSVVNVLLSVCSKVFSTFWRRNKCALKLWTLEFCLMYSIMQLICTMLTSYNSFYLLFVELSWIFF